MQRNVNSFHWLSSGPGAGPAQMGQNPRPVCVHPARPVPWQDFKPWSAVDDRPGPKWGHMGSLGEVGQGTGTGWTWVMAPPCIATAHPGPESTIWLLGPRTTLGMRRRG